MKKLFNKKTSWIIAGAVLLIILCGTAYYVYRKGIDNKEEQNKTEETNKASIEKGEGVEDSSNENDYQSLGGETPTVQTNIGELKEVALTVYVLTEDTTSQDGKTIIKAGSITPYFYVPSGIYSIQKLSAGTWVDVATNIQYPGHGGLAAGYTGPTEDNISYRALKIEENTIKLISKTFVVKRADIEGNTKTYN